MSCLNLPRLSTLTGQVNFVSCSCQAAPVISIVLGTVALSDDEGDAAKASQAPASKPAGAMDEPTHERAEIRAKSTQE